PDLVAAVDASATTPAPWLALSRFYRRTHRLDEAHQILRRGLSATGQAFDLAVELADLHIDPFRGDLALTEAKLQRTPGDSALEEIRAGLLKEINSRELDLFRLQSDRRPNDRALRLQLGVRLLIAGQADEA